jgi:hypothetical protein
MATDADPPRNEKYYLDIVHFLVRPLNHGRGRCSLTDGSQVEGCLFKVPRQPFENNSQIFRDMFGMPEIVDSPREGSSDEHPLRLEGVKSWDFEQLLRVMLTP